MSKMEIQLPEKFVFSTELDVREIDIAKGLHVSFATILDYVFEAHISFFEFLGFSVTDIEGYSLIFANLNINYLDEVLFNDRLKIEVTADNFKEKGCDEFFRITKDNGKKDVAVIKIFMLFFDYRTRKAVPIPPSFLESFKNKWEKTEKPPISELDISQKNPLWKKSHQFVLDIYQFTKGFPPEEKDNLTQKCRKLSISIPFYINELSSKSDGTELLKLYGKFKLQLEELRYYLVMANDLKFGNSKKFINTLDELYLSIKETFHIN